MAERVWRRRGRSDQPVTGMDEAAHATAREGLQVISDLHLEFQKDGGRHLLERRLELDPTARAIVLAGDIGVAGRYRHTLERAFAFFSGKFERVFWVPGNHEYYGTRVPEVEAKLRKLVALFPRVTLLEPGVIGSWRDRRVVGATLWFPPHFPAPYAGDPSDDMSDFSAIKGFRPWVIRKNGEHVQWLREVVREGDVVVTHHLPSYRSIPAKHEGAPLNVFYVSNLETLILERMPTVWIHGHTHEACDYRIGVTRVVCNPFGYPKQENTGYRTLVLDGSIPWEGAASPEKLADGLATGSRE